MGFLLRKMNVVGLKPIPAKRVRAEGESEANDSGNEFEGPTQGK